MIEGLKLTMTGDELRQRLSERIAEHERLVAHYKREAKREPDPKEAVDFVMPEHMCEYEEEFHAWRAETLDYIREHLEGGEVYRLGAADLDFGEILPEKPGMVEQEEYEREERVGHSLERIAREIDGSRFSSGALMAALADERPDRSSARVPRAGKNAAKPRKATTPR